MNGGVESISLEGLDCIRRDELDARFRPDGFGDRSE